MSIIAEMLLLETDGLDIKMSNVEIYHPHFIPLLILGDNLGLNSILGFSPSFRGHFCRFCNISRSLSQTTCKLLPELRRDYESYERDLKAANPQETGIVKKCGFNKIPSFHVVDNLSVDAMHDILEGVLL